MSSPPAHPLTGPAPGPSSGGTGAVRGGGSQQASTSHPAYSYFEHLIHALVTPRWKRGWPQDAYDCILSTCRVMQQAESFSLERACSILRQRLQRPPRTMFLQWRGEVSHASVLLRVRCGQDSLVACRLASSGHVDAATSLLSAQCILARVHSHHRRQMLKTLVGGKEFVVYNDYAYSTLAGHDPHSTGVFASYIWDKMYSVDFPWELCPNTSDARHVCATYPWGTQALVFADGSACWTKNILGDNETGEEFTPGRSAPCENGLKRGGGGKYAAAYISVEKKGPRHYWDDWGYNITFYTDVLLRCRLTH